MLRICFSSNRPPHPSGQERILCGHSKIQDLTLEGPLEGPSKLEVVMVFCFAIVSSYHDLHPQIIKELRCRVDARQEQMIASAGASDVEQVALVVVDFFQVGVVGGGLDPLLKGNDFVVAGHDDDGSEF
jgi:hypothetical protein